MKAHGKGLELTVGLTPAEIDGLLRGEIRGEARIEDYDERIFTIPLAISSIISPEILGEMEMSLSHVETTPKMVYVPHASEIFFYIGREMAEQLGRRRFTCDRFAGGHGKIKIYDLDRPDAYV